jgi:xanthine dehydrogenase accessory factor
VSIGLDDIPARLEHCEALVRIVVIASEGSVPREAGASMIVSRQGQEGTIGGGALELSAVDRARSLLDASDTPYLRSVISVPLGPNLGQCCGGNVKILYERFFRNSQIEHNEKGGEAGLYARPLASGSAPILLRDRKTLPDDLPLHVRSAILAMLIGREPHRPLLVDPAGEDQAWWIEPARPQMTNIALYGAGHVGREIVRVMAGLPVNIIWIDTAAERFPETLPDHVQRLIAQNPADAVAHIPADSLHLVLTYSHAIDLAVCLAVLARDEFGFLGLIGSATKRTRFIKRLGEAGIDPARLARLTCPIGIGDIHGKEPAIIAVSVAAQVLQLMQQRQPALTTLKEHA